MNTSLTTIPSELAGLTVFIVDDTQANIDVLRGMLEMAGCRSILGEKDPRRALEAFEASPPDLVVLDWHMPALSGQQVLASLRQALGPDDFLPVVVLTADSTWKVREAALMEGATDFLSKPFDMGEVVLRVRNLLNARAMHLHLREEKRALETEVESFAKEERRAASERAEMVARVTEVLDSRALSMVFQPIVHLDDGAVVGVEALARFSSPPQRPPNEWFSEAASVDLGTALELLAIELAIAGIKHLPQGAYLSVNVSASTACDPAFEQLVRESPAHRLVIELTEHTRVDDYEEVVAALTAVRELGVAVAVDDAGTGYAGLQHILRLEPDLIKLDRALIQGIDLDKGRRAMAASQVAFAREVGAVLIAEGVETENERVALQQLGVECGQGYLFARPAPLPLGGP